MEYIDKYFKGLDKSKLDKLLILEDIYKNWNSKINLISRKDISNFYLHHVVHSLSISKFAKFRKGDKILDLGTGGGFPGIPLAIIFPESKFILLDSIRKKTIIIEEIKKVLKLDNVDIVCDRSENIVDKYNFCIGRFVADIKVFFSLSKMLVDKGIYYLKGGETEFDFLNKSKNNFQEYDLSDVFEEEYFFNKKLIYISF